MSSEPGAGKRLVVSGIEVDEPLLSREAVERFYRDPRVVATYEANRFRGGWKHPEEMDALLCFVRRARPSRLLDLATGTGRAVHGVAGDVGRLSVACDLSRPMLAANRRREAGERVDYAQASAFALPFATASVDFVVCLRCLRHFDRANRAAIYAEIRRVLRPGGQLVLDAANHARHRHELSDRHIFDATYTRPEFERELRDNGFRVGDFWGTVTGCERLCAAAVRWGVPRRLATRWFHRAHRVLRARPWVVERSYLWIVRCERP